MADITKCLGEGCPLKDMCYRFIAPEDIYQSYFMTPPWDEDNRTCEMFWGDGAQRLMEELEKIVNGEGE